MATTPNFPEGSLGLLAGLLKNEQALGPASLKIEQHKLLWCMLATKRLVRPEALCWTSGREQKYLRWRDIDFINCGLRTFMCRIRQQEDSLHKYGQIEVIYHDIPAPLAHFSVPRRLLELGTQRNIIEEADSVHDTFTKPKVRQVRVKAAYLDDPVFCAAIDGTGAIDRSLAMPATEIEDVLLSRGSIDGRQSPITTTSFRQESIPETWMTGFDSTEESKRAREAALYDHLDRLEADMAAMARPCEASIEHDDPLWQLVANALS